VTDRTGLEQKAAEGRKERAPGIPFLALPGVLLVSRETAGQPRMGSDSQGRGFLFELGPHGDSVAWDRHEFRELARIRESRVSEESREKAQKHKREPARDSLFAPD